MPAKFFVIEKNANKSISKLPFYLHKKIDLAFDAIKSNPLIGTKLGGELKDYYKFRLGNYRLIYSFNSKTSTVFIHKIEHRQGVYKLIKV